MDTYYTIEEKYLQAIEELNYGELPKSLKILNEILADEPLYARAHFQLGKLYYYDLKDYYAAGYHFKTCIELEPGFPDVYVHYIKLLVFLNKGEQVTKVSAAALSVPGVYPASVYNLMGLCCENNQKWHQAINLFNTGLMHINDKSKKTEIEGNIKRVKFKIAQSKPYVYQLCD